VYLWQIYYGKCYYGKSIMANETEPCQVKQKESKETFSQNSLKGL